jgi:hypothetical protein
VNAPAIELNIPELLNADDLATAPFRSHDYVILPVHIVWTEDKLNRLFDYMVHIMGFGRKALSDLKVMSRSLLPSNYPAV